VESRGAGSVERSSVGSITILSQAQNYLEREILMMHAAQKNPGLFNQSIVLVDIIVTAYLDFRRT